MPSSLRWAAQSSIHLKANSVSGPSRGMKSAAKAVRRPSPLVPTIWSEGMLMTPRSTTPATMESSSISSRI